jgi:hypothetical protein
MSGTLDISYPCFDTFDLGLFLLTREFDQGVVDAERTRYFISLDDNTNLPSCVSNLIASFISEIIEDSSAKILYNRMKDCNLIPINYPHDSIFLVHILCTNNQLAIDYVEFLLRRKEMWPPFFIDTAIDKMTTQLNETITLGDIETVKNICSLVGPNGVRELNQFFAMRPFNTMTRDVVIEEYNHTAQEPGIIPPGITRQLTNYGPEKLMNTCLRLAKYINPRVPVILASYTSKPIFDFLRSVGADTTGVDEYTGEEIPV